VQVGRWPTAVFLSAEATVRAPGSAFGLVDHAAAGGFSLYGANPPQDCSRKIARSIEDYLEQARAEIRIPVEGKLSSSLLIVFREDWEPDVFKTQWR
jgi:hypothetical protein